MNKLKLLFLFQSPTVWPSLQSLYEVCLNDERVEAKMMLSTEETVEKGHMAGAKEYLLKNGYDFEEITEEALAKYQPNIVFLQLPYDTSCRPPHLLTRRLIREGAKIVYIPYGNETADSDEVRRVQYENFVVENCWRIYTGSDEILKEYVKYCRNRHAVRSMGIPKYDAIIHTEKYKINEEIKKLANGRKIIVWKMHFPKRDATADGPKLVTPEIQVYLEFVKHISEYQDMFFVILAHPKLVNRDVASKTYRSEQQMTQLEVLLEKALENENVFIDTSLDYRNTLYNADAVIMDRSGLLLEIAMLNIPTIYLLNDKYEETYLPFVKDILSTYASGNSVNDILAFLKEQREGIDYKASQRKVLIEKYIPYLDGDCSKRILDDIVESYSLEEEEHIPRIVMYGCGSVCDYYIDKYKMLEKSNYEVIAFADSDSKRWGQQYYGYTVVAPEKLIEIRFDYLIVTSEMFYFDIKKYLVYDKYIDERKIKRLDDFAVEMLLEKEVGE